MPKCKFAHKCPMCGKEHPAVTCEKWIKDS
jgi:hypothetical protein